MSGPNLSLTWTSKLTALYLQKYKLEQELADGNNYGQIASPFESHQVCFGYQISHFGPSNARKYSQA